MPVEFSGKNFLDERNASDSVASSSIKVSEQRWADLSTTTFTKSGIQSTVPILKSLPA
jgi:hypothetical protein